MLIGKCDKCGFEKEYSGIVSHHFKVTDDFEELTDRHRTKSVVDLCKKCFKIYKNEYFSQRQNIEKSAIQKAKELFFGV